MIPAHLIEKVEVGADAYGVHIVNNFHSLGTYKKQDFKVGADFGYQLAIDEQKKLLDEAFEIIKLVTIQTTSGEYYDECGMDIDGQTTIEARNSLIEDVRDRFAKLKAHRGVK